MSTRVAWVVLLLFAASLGAAFHFYSPAATTTLALISALLLCAASERGGLSVGRLYVCGVVNQGIGFYWLPKVLGTFGDLSLPTSWALGVVLFAIQGLRYLLLGLLYRFLRQKLKLAPAVCLPAAWTATELLAPSFMPWYLGTILWSIVPLRYSAAFFGVIGTGFVFLLVVHALVSIAIADKGSRRLGPLTFVAVGLAVVCGISYYHSLQLPLIDKAEKLKVGLIQPNLDPLKDFRAEKVHDNIQKYRMLSAELLSREDPELLVWAESSVGLTYFENQRHITRGTEGDPMPGLSIPLIFGGQAAAGEIDEKPAYFTSIFTMEPSGRIASIYHKQELLPISEKPIFGSDWFVRRPFAIRPGESQNALRWILSGREFVAAAVICFEDLWPEVLKTMLKESPDFMLVLTNDNWFLRSAAAKQHAYLARWRAVEFGKSLVRASNDGLTLAVDPLGRTLLELEPFVENSGVAEVPLVKGTTFYAKYGDNTIWILIAVLLTASLLIPTRRKV